MGSDTLLYYLTSLTNHKEQKMNIDIYTDGSSSVNYQSGAYAVVIVADKQIKTFAKQGRTTNIAALELEAMTAATLELLFHAGMHGAREFNASIHSDSQAAVAFAQSVLAGNPIPLNSGVSLDWVEARGRFMRAASRLPSHINLSVRKIKGHSGGNDKHSRFHALADSLAKSEAMLQSLQREAA